GAPEHAGDLDREAARDGGGGGVREHGHPGARRRRLRGRPSRRALLPRCARDDAVRGHLPDSETDHRAGDDGHKRARAQLAASGAESAMDPHGGATEEERAGEAGQRAGAAAVIGVLGAGTMGAGIAQLAARAGSEALLYDPIADALAKGVERAREGLTKEASRGRLSAQEAQAAAQRLAPVPELSALADCERVIEAAPA